MNVPLLSARAFALPYTRRQRSAYVTALVGALVGAACRSADPAVLTSERGPWIVSEVPTGAGVLVAAAIVELDAEGQGREVVVLSESGAIQLLRRGADGLGVETIAQLPFTAYAIGTGELDAAHEGAEFVVLTGDALAGEPDDSSRGAGSDGDSSAFRGRAWLCTREPVTEATSNAPRFVAREIWAAPERLEALLVADLDPGAIGDEVLLAEGEGRLTLLRRKADGGLVASPWTCRDSSGVLDLGAFGPIRTLTRTTAGVLVGFENGALHEFERPSATTGVGDSDTSPKSWMLCRSAFHIAPAASVVARDGEWLIGDFAGGVRVLASAAAGAVERTTQLRPIDGDFCKTIGLLTDPWGLGSVIALAAEAGTATTGSEGPRYVFTSGPFGMLRVLRLSPWASTDELSPPAAQLASYQVEEQHLGSAKGAVRALVAGPICGREPACVAVGPAGSLLFVERREPDAR